MGTTKPLSSDSDQHKEGVKDGEKSNSTARALESFDRALGADPKTPYAQGFDKGVKNANK